MTEHGIHQVQQSFFQLIQIQRKVDPNPLVYKQRIYGETARLVLQHVGI